MSARQQVRPSPMGVLLTLQTMRRHSMVRGLGQGNTRELMLVRLLLVVACMACFHRKFAQPHRLSIVAQIQTRNLQFGLAPQHRQEVHRLAEQLPKGHR